MADPVSRADVFKARVKISSHELAIPRGRSDAGTGVRSPENRPSLSLQRAIGATVARPASSGSPYTIAPPMCSQACGGSAPPQSTTPADSVCVQPARTNGVRSTAPLGRGVGTTVNLACAKRRYRPQDAIATTSAAATPTATLTVDAGGRPTVAEMPAGRVAPRRDRSSCSCARRASLFESSRPSAPPPARIRSISPHLASSTPRWTSLSIGRIVPCRGRSPPGATRTPRSPSPLARG